MAKEAWRTDCSYKDMKDGDLLTLAMFAHVVRIAKSRLYQVIEEKKIPTKSDGRAKCLPLLSKAKTAAFLEKWGFSETIFERFKEKGFDTSKLTAKTPKDKHSKKRVKAAPKITGTPTPASIAKKKKRGTSNLISHLKYIEEECKKHSLKTDAYFSIIEGAQVEGLIG